MPDKPTSRLYTEVTKDIDVLMQAFSHTKKDIGYGWRRTFANKMRFDLIDYQRKWMVILRVGRGARLAREYPMLHGRFDVVSKVIGKLVIHDRQTIHEKHLWWVLELLDQAPDRVWVLV